MTDLLTNHLRYLLLFPKKKSLVWATIVVTSFQSEHVVITTKELKPIRGGVELPIVSCTLFLPTKSMEVHVIVVSF
jgi:hypothetical protein